MRSASSSMDRDKLMTFSSRPDGLRLGWPRAVSVWKGAQ
jgi:hypothetical protein